MSKRFKFAGKRCVYCAQQPATTADHVWSRKFFLVPRRGNLPQVPACPPCNNGKSSLELYLTAVLPFGGRHADAAENLTDLVPRRLDENQALHRRLAAGLEQQETAGGQAMVVPFELEKLTGLFEYVARGLAWHHWREMIAPDTEVWAGLLSAPGEVLFSTLFAYNASRRVSHDVGAGTFVYEGAQSPSNPQLTIWRFVLFGGAVFSGDPNVPQECNSVIAVVTGPKVTIERFVSMAEGGVQIAPSYG